MQAGKSLLAELARSYTLTKADHSSAVKESGATSGFFESRTSTAAEVIATSTQALVPQ